MTVTATLTDASDSTKSASLSGSTPGKIDLAIEDQSRQIDPLALARAIQNGLNVGPTVTAGFLVSTTVPENPSSGNTLVVANHATNKALVIISAGDKSRTLNGAEIQRAMRSVQS